MGFEDVSKANPKLPVSDSEFVSLDNGGSSADHGIPTPGSSKLSQTKRGVEKGVRRKASVSKVIDGVAGNVASNISDPKGMDASKEGKIGSLNVSSSVELPKGNAGKNSQRLPASPAPRIAEGVPSNSILGQIDPKIAQNIAQASPQASDGEIAHGRSKGTAERKTRRSSAKTAGKDNAKKGIQAKEMTPVRQSERGDKSSNVSLSPSGIFHLMQSNDMQHYGHTLTPVHPFQTPPIRNLLGPNASWMSQPSYRGPWVAPPQPSLPEASTRLTTFPVTEAVQLTPVKETAVPHLSGTKHVSSSPMVQTGAPASVFTAASPALDLKKVTSSPGQHSSDPKPRKRKKNQVSEEIGQIVLQSQPPQREPVLPPVVSSSLSTSVAITTPASFVSQTTAGKLVVSVSPTSSFDPLKKVDPDVMQRFTLSEDTLSKIKEASKQAEDAASLAAAAVEVGPEGYWRAPQVSSELVAKSTDVYKEQSKLGGVGEAANTSAKHSKDGRSGKKETQMTANEKSTISRGVSKESIGEHLRLVDGISGSASASEKELRGQKGHKVSDLTKNIVVVLESESISNLSSVNVENVVERAADVPGENSIKEGSKVEVFKDGDGFKAAWYPANVVNLDDGKACVSYTEIEHGEGSADLREWVALEGQGDDPPKIRIARPVTAMRYEGTRKRRRAALGDYNWSIGDRVDAWMTNSWWEGVVTEKNNKDETSVTVQFPVQGETSAVKAWHLRPSLIWKDGEWVEWSNLQNDSASQEGDIPQEKRLKLGSPVMEAKGKDKMSKSTGILVSGKPEESRLLDLSANDKVFNIGKGIRNESKPDTTRMARTGLQQEGSRVIFGVPKPGKKRKFMEVSKHYVADRSNKNSEANDSLKYLRYTAPQSQGSGSRAFKNDSKEKRVAESKLKGLKSGKPQSVLGRTVPQRENFTTNAVSTSGDGTTGEHAARIKDSSSHVDNTSRRQNTVEAGSFSNSDGAAEGPFVFSSVAPTLDGPSKKSSASTAKVERANKGKLAPGSGKLSKVEDKVFNGNSVKSTTEVMEPRRSNRRIQPTSRLLEGLQSSLIIPKFPSVSHDKGHRGPNRNTSRGNNHG
ncbi:Agenet domain containing protein [Parasponia andersonii]|uniref:Agenet domain containing protein n=1 Tax=Parasponia andersonii TaxID=3476 RepID=A0A2P5AMF1_PARAD|nr:Agenet domain containing protein [Parasponia andersonii]